jgi:polar amino acid transport system permease protein
VTATSEFTGMGSADVEDTDDAPASPHISFEPHRHWYKRADILIGIAVAVLGIAILWFGVEGNTSPRTRMTADGDSDFDWMYFWHLVPLMWNGLLVTVKATVFGFMIAVSLGLLLALGRRSQQRAIRWPFALAIEFIRSTPLLVQLFFFQALVRTSDLVDLDPISVLAIGLGVHYATYCSEAYRAGINSVDTGQWEASTALNLGPFTKWSRVILPQAVPNVLPAMGNYLVAAFKDAPLGYILNVPTILFWANSVRGADFRPVEPYILVGIGFLMASLPAAWSVRRLERKIAYERT